MKTKKYLLLILPLVAIAILASSLLSKPLISNSSKTVKPTVTETPQRNIITQTIDYGGSRDAETDVVVISEGQSALDVITASKNIKTKEYSFGKLVDSINGVVNGTDNKYWILYVNSKKSDVGAGDYKVKNGDVITWRFEAYEE